MALREFLMESIFCCEIVGTADVVVELSPSDFEVVSGTVDVGPEEFYILFLKVITIFPACLIQAHFEILFHIVLAV